MSPGHYSDSCSITCSFTHSYLLCCSLDNRWTTPFTIMWTKRRSSIISEENAFLRPCENSATH